MNPLQNFAYGDNLVRTVQKDGEIWFVAADICRVLGIDNNRMAVEKLDDDEKGVSSTDTLGGKQDLLIVSESGMFTLILRSRAATTQGSVAHSFRKWVTAEVLPAIRRTGGYSAADAQPNLQALNEKRMALDMVSEARRMYGPARARMMWEALGLPAVPPLPDVPTENPRDCLNLLLAFETPRGTLRDLIRPPFTADLREFGVICDESGIYIANSHPVVMTIMRDHPRFWRSLAHINGAVAIAGKKFGKRSHRAVFLPHTAL